MSPAAMYSFAVRTISSNWSRDTFEVTFSGGASPPGARDNARSSSRSTKSMRAQANW
ncbi:hypothetical protein D3C83_59110 [compost metagenome]